MTKVPDPWVQCDVADLVSEFTAGDEEPPKLQEMSDPNADDVKHQQHEFPPSCGEQTRRCRPKSRRSEKREGVQREAWRWRWGRSVPVPKTGRLSSMSTFAGIESTSFANVGLVSSDDLGYCSRPLSLLVSTKASSIYQGPTFLCLKSILTPKGRGPYFGLFLEFGQPIVDAIFVQKISNFWWTCGLVLASGRTNFYKIPISGLAIMPKKQNYFELRAALGSQKTFYF